MRRIFFVCAAVLAVGCGSGAARPDPHSAIQPETHGCALTDDYPTASADPRTRTTLIPSGATPLTLCPYRGLNPHPNRVGTLLRSVATTNSAEVGRLATALNRLPSFPHAPIACPADDSSEVVARFTNPHAPVDAVVVDLTGCQGVGNGHVKLWAGNDQALITEAPRAHQLMPYPVNPLVAMYTVLAPFGWIRSAGI